METTEQQLNIIETNDISIAQIRQLQEEGVSVVRSAHVGNLRPYNLALAASGINMLLVDHNMTGIDANYRPGSIVEGGEEKQIVRDGMLTCRAVTNDGNRLDMFHIDALQTALPKAKILTNTQSVQQAKEVVTEITEIARQIMPEAFRRVVMEDGTVRPVDDGADLLKGGMKIMQLADDPRAEKKMMLLPNVVDIVKDFVIELMSSGNETLVHLSGPDMVSYLGFNKDGTPKEARQMVCGLFDEICSKATFKDLLPPTCTVLLVPTTAARFATTMKRKDALDALLETVGAESFSQPLDALRRERAEFAREADKSAPEFKTVTTEFVARERKLYQKVADASREVPELFIGPRDGGFVSQYDLVREGGIYIPEENTELTMTELNELYNGILKARKMSKL